MFGDLLKGLKDSLGGLLGNAGGIDQNATIWEKIKSGAATAGRETTKMGVELFLIMKSKDTKMMDKAIIGAALAYQFLPNDMISTKEYGALGAVDNAIALGVAYSRMKKYITPEIEAEANQYLEKWFGPAQSAAAEPAPQIAPAPVEAPAETPSATE